jgi:hypothetical protein
MGAYPPGISSKGGALCCIIIPILWDNFDGHFTMSRGYPFRYLNYPPLEFRVSR